MRASGVDRALSIRYSSQTDLICVENHVPIKPQRVGANLLDQSIDPYFRIGIEFAYAAGEETPILVGC